jgi:hypothetical protein
MKSGFRARAYAATQTAMNGGTAHATRSATFRATPVVLPSQYLRHDAARCEPHKHLMAAVLQTAVDDHWGSGYRRVPRNWTPAEIRAVGLATAYVESRDRRWPFSFENLCEALGLDPVSFRRQIQNEPRRRPHH